jgi:lysophospholipase L1-like esterase
MEDRTMERRLMLRAARIAAVLAIAAGAPASGAGVYLSLGDSVGLGEGAMPWTASYGTNQGYVPLYATYLATKNGGVQPAVLNLAVPGETTASFFSGSGRVGPNNQAPTAAEDATLVALNKNYTDYAAAHGGTVPTQQDLLARALATEGKSISNVTISLGSDDLYKLVLTDPNPAADLPKTLTTLAGKYAGIVEEIRAASPNAQITLVGSYDPYPPGTPGAIAALAGPAITALNQTISTLASQLHVSFADSSAAIGNNQLADTYIASGNVHPNAAGYAAIAGAIEAVPEPSTFAVMALGAAGWAVAGRVRRSRKLGV